MGAKIKTLAVCNRCGGDYDRSKRSTGNVNLCGPCWKIVQDGAELKPDEGNALLPRPKDAK